MSLGFARQGIFFDEDDRHHFYLRQAMQVSAADS